MHLPVLLYLPVHLPDPGIYPKRKEIMEMEEKMKDLNRGGKQHKAQSAHIC
jgi:hypothetical protein